MNHRFAKRLEEFFRLLTKRGTVTKEAIHSIIDAGEEEGVLNLDEHEMTLFSRLKRRAIASVV